MKRQALLVIDLQNDYYPSGKWPLHKIEQATENTQQLLSQFRSSNQPVIHVYHEFESDDAPFFTIGSQGAEIHHQVKPIAGEDVVRKTTVNAFLNTNLQQILQQKNIEELVIVGAMSHMCIDAAVRAASDFGFSCIVPQDACASRDLEINGQVVAAEQVHNAYMAALGFAYAEVTDTEQLLHKLKAA
ncbi:cysteine hydrolase family protein [Pelagibaculum spongiae]|uniref:Cysteine hydrolase n=1 Tax=Pelagibaculum spongiae TaxID=2080658 RepID=A0A2V1GVR8_9GAMM|nr:cysteine hydrolase family protein [Pelagibaculum spongiae]PVZ64358.1 cysteine hydrolase [Pelagibaculum spongiae]